MAMRSLYFKRTQDTPYLAKSSELWAQFVNSLHKIYRRNIEGPLYSQLHIYCPLNR